MRTLSRRRLRRALWALPWALLAAIYLLELSSSEPRSMAPAAPTTRPSSGRAKFADHRHASANAIQTGLDASSLDGHSLDGQALHEPATTQARVRSIAACEAAFHTDADWEPVVASWNLRWFPFGVPPNRATPDSSTNTRWMACIMAHLGASVIAVQEVINSESARVAQAQLLRALDEFTGGHHRIILDPCSAESLHVGFIYDAARVTLLDQQLLASLNPLGSACASRLRPGLLARFRFTSGMSGQEVSVVVVHFDSGVTARDYRHRRQSLAALRAWMATATTPALVLGDFNTMGCPRCESPVTADEERATLDSDHGLVRLSGDWACSQYYRGRGSLLDHVLATEGLAKRARLSVGGLCAAYGCQPFHAEALPFFKQVSDHCPLRVELDLQD